MKKLHFKTAFYVTLVIALFLCVTSSRAAQTGELKHVLLLHSYHSGYKWTDEINTALQERLNRSSGIDLRIEYLDTKRFFSDEYFQSEFNYLSVKYADTSFDLIISSDNHALNFLVKYRPTFFPDVPIIFCGVNSFTDADLKGETNIVGVNEAVHPERTIDLMLSHYPETKRIVVINDKSKTASVVSEDIKTVSRNYQGIEWSFLSDKSLEDIQTILGSLREGELVLLGLFFSDINGRHIEYDESAQIISTASPVPVYALWDFYLGYGVVGGYLSSGTFQGRQAAELAFEVLSGISADSIAVVMESPNNYFADYSVLKRFSIPADLFPDETIFINRPPDFYEDHKISIWLVGCLLSALSAISIILSISVVKRRRAEAELLGLTRELELRVNQRTEQLERATLEIKDREAQVQHMLSNLPGMVYRCQNNENWTMLYVSDGVKNLTGYNRDDLAGENAPLEFSQLIDEADALKVSEAVASAVAGHRKFTLEYRIRTKDGQLKWVWEQGSATYDKNGDVLFLEGFITDISERKLSEQELLKLATAIDQTDDIIVITDPAGTIEYVNPAFTRITGYSIDEALGKNPRMLKSGIQDSQFYGNLWQSLLVGKVWRGRLVNRRKDGSNYIAQVVISPIRDQVGGLSGYVGVQRDVTHEIDLEKKLLHAQKLEAIGTLAGGIAHEINTPAQYVSSNLDFIIESLPGLKTFISAWGDQAAADKIEISELTRLKEIYEENDIDFLLEELPLAAEQSQDGITQISSIVRSMKEFAHPGEKEKVMTDINDALGNTVKVCANEWKYVAEVELQLDPDLPHINCHRSDMNQVFLNLIVNAAQAIESVRKTDSEKGKIVISTYRNGDWGIISIKDNGGGIPEEIRDRVYNPFFTTKEPGKGTGQGLAICHSIITEKHGGEISLESTIGTGTTFFIRLPLK